MWISRTKYDQLVKTNKALHNKVKVLENDKKILLNILRPDIVDLDYPNTSERGLGDSDTPTNLSDLFSNF